MNFVEAVVDKLRDALELMKKLESSWEHLQYNSDTLKDDIEDACSDQIAVVGQRKNRLCFEVDLLVSEPKRRIQSDLAKLNHYQSSLRSLFQLYNAGKLNDENAFSCLQVFELPNVTIEVPQLLFAKTGQEELEKAARGFGCAKLHPPSALGDFVASETSLFSGECLKDSESNETWLLCDMRPTAPCQQKHCDRGISVLPPDNYSGEDEMVAASLPKSLSATSSSIEAVSVDEDEPAGTFHKLVEDHSKRNHMMDLEQDQSSWLLPNHGYSGKNELRQTKTFCETKTSDIKNEVANWPLIPKDCVTCEDDLVMSKTSNGNSEWLITSKAKPMPTSCSYTTTIREMFKPYFDHGNDSIWIANAL
ncbi:uncharacterized protein LOC119186573 isoform X3 [Rhipicephalus microplus]